jgi:hypothetical protein
MGDNNQFQPVNPNPQQPQLGPAMDPAVMQALLAALGKNQGLETLQFLQQSGMTRNIQSSPRNVGGAENPSLQQMTDGPNPFFRSETDRQARIASSPVAQTPSLLSSTSQDFQSRFAGPGVRPTPAPALGSAENPFLSPDGRRIVVLPNGSLGSGGGQGNLPFEAGEFKGVGNELAPFMENAGGVYADPRSYAGAGTQAAAMDARDLRQGQIQQQLRGELGRQPQMSGLAQAQPAQGFSMEDLADGPQSGGVIQKTTPPESKHLTMGRTAKPPMGNDIPNPFVQLQPQGQIPGQVVPGQSDSKVPLIRNVYNTGEQAMSGLAWLMDMMNQGVTNPVAQQLGLPGYAPNGNQDWMKQQWAQPDPNDWMTFFFGNQQTR